MNRQDRRKVSKRNRGMLVTASLAAGSIFGYVGYTRPAFANGSTCSVQGNVGTVSGGNNAALVQSMTDCIADLSSGGVIDFDDNDVDETTVINVTTPFVIDKSLTIQGSSTTDEVWPVFDGGNTGEPGSFTGGSGVFESTSGDFTLSGIGISNTLREYVQGGQDPLYGGAVYQSDPTGSLSLRNVIFKNNFAQYGGAVYAKGNVSIYSSPGFTSKFEENGLSGLSGKDAGAIFADQNLTVTGSTLFGQNGKKYPSAFSYGKGGAILAKGDVTIIGTQDGHSVFTGNRGQSGGAIYLTGDLKISGPHQFIGNIAERSGGAIYSKEASIYADSDTGYVSFEQNFAKGTGSWSGGGAIYNFSPQNSGNQVQLENSIFNGNNSLNYGGAVRAIYADLEINEAIFFDNSAADFGGAISTYSSDAVVENSFFGLNSATSGGAVHLYSAWTVGFTMDVSIRNSVFTENTASAGGAIFSYVPHSSNSTISVSNSSLFRNYADNGTAIFEHAVNQRPTGTGLNLDFVTIYENYDSDNNGDSAVYVTANSSAIISNSIVSNNSDSNDKSSFSDLGDRVTAEFSLTSADGNMGLTRVDEFSEALDRNVFNHLVATESSPAIGAANPGFDFESVANSSLTSDQIGTLRPVDTPSTIGAIQVAAVSASPPSFSAPVPTTSPILNLEENKPFSQGETVVARVSNATRVESVSIGDTEAEIISFEDGLLTFTVPELEAGSYSITGEFNSGTVIFDVGIEITGQTVSEAQELNVWTKKISDTEAKVYAKNPIGNGKIQFFVDGEEIAWVRAEDETDSKLRQAQGNYYLVRTVELTDSKQAIEIFVDGVRAWRAAYTAN